MAAGIDDFCRRVVAVSQTREGERRTDGERKAASLRTYAARAAVCVCVCVWAGMGEVSLGGSTLKGRNDEEKKTEVCVCVCVWLGMVRCGVCGEAVKRRKGVTCAA